MNGKPIDWPFNPAYPNYKSLHQMEESVRKAMLIRRTIFWYNKL